MQGMKLGLAFMLFESFYAISLPTDPIHREDWKGATHWIMKNATTSDLILVLEPQFTYYRMRTNKKLKAFGIWSLDQNVSDNEKVFIMDGYSMMEHNNQRNEAIFTTAMLKQGFHKENMVKFGGQDGHTVVFVFKRNS